MISNIAVLVVAALHLGFLVLEMFVWTKALGLKVFRQTPAEAQATKVLAANQGLYNGFIAAGLVWSALAQPANQLDLKVFFLSCVIIAGVFGAVTAVRQILWVQAVPAAIALVLALTIGS